MRKVYLISLCITVIMSSVYGIYKYGYLKGRQDLQVMELEKANKNMSAILDKVEKFDALQAEMEMYRIQIRQGLEAHHKVVREEVVKYENNPISHGKCLDDNWVRIYNIGLPK